MRRTLIFRGFRQEDYRVRGEGGVVERQPRRGEIGAGVYSLTDLARFVSFQHQRAYDRRTVGYLIRSGLSEEGHRSHAADYTFGELISAFVVSALAHAGVRLAAIRDAETYLRDQLGFERPFATLRFFTDGQDVLFEAYPEVAEQLTAANRGGQEVLTQAIKPWLRNVEFRHDLAVSWRPAKLVTVDPHIQFGAPCVAGTRITTAQLGAMVDAGQESVDEVAAEYRLPTDAVIAAVRFERELLAVSA